MSGIMFQLTYGPLSYPVSTRINHLANDDEARSVPVELAETQNRFFL